MTKRFTFFTKILSTLFITAVLSSCFASKRARVKKLIGRTDLMIREESAGIASLGQKKDSAFYEERIDTTISNRITARLMTLMNPLDSAKQEASYLSEILKNKKEFRKQYKSAVLARITYLENFYKKRKVRLYKVYVINKAIDIADKKQFELAAFFGPGKYVIPKESYNQAVTIFSPVIDSVVKFGNMYDSLHNTATIVVNGYADATGVGAGSELEKILLGYLKESAAPKAELNRAISELRARQINMLLTEKALLNKWKVFKNPQNISMEFIGYGQGETFPSKSINNYSIDDPRRRIVLIYWIVLPD
ncbi:MAG: hypothetical protein WAT19_03815 [Ferruginibacter sp.]